jgi:hypothetical protein
MFISEEAGEAIQKDQEREELKSFLRGIRFALNNNEDQIESKTKKVRKRINELR